MGTESEVTINDVWPKLCELGLIELRINGKTVWSDSALDVMSDRSDYVELMADYLKRAEEALLGKDYSDFRVTSISISVIDFHHCVADVAGYYKYNNILESEAE